MKELDKNGDGFVLLGNETVWSEEEVLESFPEADLDRDGSGC